MTNGKKIKGFFLTAALALMCSTAHAQSDPSPVIDCGEYQWPEVTNPCPEVQIKQKHDHTPQARYRHEGWDTAVTCTTPQIVLSCMPYIPVKRFNGTYYVDQIPYNPADTTFCLVYGAALDNMGDPKRKRMPISTDDDFAPASTNIPYPFYFFGIRKNYFRLGANGLVTFTTDFGSGTSNPWSYSAPIPWTPTTSGKPGDDNTFNRMHDAIYGIYEDTYPSPSVHGNDGDPNWGIYYGVLDEYPCRKIICSWNDVPQFSCTSLRCTYQIVCYEGSNIIEVHVKQRQVCTSWNGGRGLIGIQNATGQAQVRPEGNPNISPQANGKPAAFYPIGYNLTTSDLDTIAFRFTPAGDNLGKSYHWYRIFDDGRDSIDLKNAYTDPTAMDDTNGYFIPMDDASSCPTLTKAYVSPTVTSRYVFNLRFQNANNDWYDLYDTITVGKDTVKTLVLAKAGANIDDPNGQTLNVCKNNLANMVLHMNSIQDTARTEWHLFRVSGNDTTELANPLQMLNFGNINDDGIHKTMPFTLNTTNIPNAPINKIDGIQVQCIADFTNGCHNHNESMTVNVYPNFDTTTVAGICRGEKYHWSANNQDYTETTNPATTVEHLHSAPGCDSTVHLDLTVYDVSHTVDHIMDCKPIKWLNGKTYSESNTATALQDTIILPNQYGCDSVVQLDFTIHPLTAKIESNIEYFTLDNLDAMLTDISIGGNGRVWKFPSSADQTGPVAYYSIPAELDGANILLIESSEYGCVDTATIYLPLNKEHFWVPNAFTPDNPSGNNLFSSISSKTLRQEMIIYNRRGEMVFRCEGVDCAWDGRDLNGKPCIQGAYVYVIRYTNEFEPNQTKVLTGSVTLLR